MTGPKDFLPLRGSLAVLAEVLPAPAAGGRAGEVAGTSLLGIPGACGEAGSGDAPPASRLSSGSGEPTLPGCAGGGSLEEGLGQGTCAESGSQGSSGPNLWVQRARQETGFCTPRFLGTRHKESPSAPAAPRRGWTQPCKPRAAAGSGPGVAAAGRGHGRLPRATGPGPVNPCWGRNGSPSPAVPTAPSPSSLPHI